MKDTFTAAGMTYNDLCDDSKAWYEAIQYGDVAQDSIVYLLNDSPEAVSCDAERAYLLAFYISLLDQTVRSGSII